MPGHEAANVPGGEGSDVSGDAWDPQRYERFKAEREQPFHDLLAGLESVPGGRMADLGCGTGELTRLAHERLGMAETIGIDRSAAMLARAAEHAGAGLRFVKDDLATAEPDGTFDVVVSNAALHWLADQHTVLARWIAALRPGGQVAFQVPANFDHPSHTAAYAVAAEPEFAALLAGPTGAGGIESEPGSWRPREYAAALDALGCTDVRVSLHVYLHRLASTDAIAEWTRGTFLTRFERALPPDAFARFLDRYRARLVELLGDHRPYLFTFDRILAWARCP
jgi:trans-aconitate 2-methyltransferase